jgi:hypothetical protein
MNEHERGFVAFLAEPGRGRMLRLLELGEKRRADVRALLNHAVALDPRFSRHLDGGDAFPRPVEALLRKRGAPEGCHVLAADADLDGSDMVLSDALAAVIGKSSGAFISCIPGRLGFYEYEDARSSYLLSR